MKYLKCIFIFFLTLSFSANILIKKVSSDELSPEEVAVFSNSSAANDSTNEYNNTFINMPKDGVVEVFNHNDSLIYLTQKDVNLMAQIVYAESKGEPYEGKVAVASVILNRVLSSGFPNTIQEVIFQPNAFSCVVNGQISVEPTQECYNAVYEAIKGNDPTNEALFFYNPAIATCSWMHDVAKADSRSIGQHLFFKPGY
ncbi:cell wall hydrolase [Clostridium carnis]